VSSIFALADCGLLYNPWTGSACPGTSDGTFVHAIGSSTTIAGDLLLAPDTPIAFAVDGTLVYFLNSAGELRVLPLP
jgi:hypothetical protein